LKVDGTSLVQLGGSVTMATFVDRLHRQKSNHMVSQQANFILDHLADVHREMPNMIQQRHQMKHLVVASSQQSVYNLGEQLKRFASRKKIKSCLGKPLVVGVFFSGTVQSPEGKAIRDREANGGKEDSEMLEASDIIVCCCKFLAGWDEWRLCSVFLCKRVYSEEFLQQMLARATRARPGTGKRRPLVFDLANHPDDVCAAVARFWSETRHFEGPLGEVIDLSDQIKAFGAMALPAPEAVARLNGGDQVLLRASIVRYYRAAATFSAAELPLSFDQLSGLLLELNLALRIQLFGGDYGIAKSEAEQTAALRARTPGDGSGNGGHVAKKTLPAALRHLRTALHLGRAKRPRTDDAPVTPAKRKKIANAEVAVGAGAGVSDSPPSTHLDGVGILPGQSDCGPSLETPAKTEAAGLQLATSPPVKKAPAIPDLPMIKEGLKQAVSDVAERYWNQLPDEGDAETPDTREAELKIFRFAAYPLRRFSLSAVLLAEKSLRSKLSDNLGSIMKAYWQQQRKGLEQKFKEKLVELQGTYGETPSEELCQAAEELAEEVSAELTEVVDQVGGRTAGWQKRFLRKSIEALMPRLELPVA